MFEKGREAESSNFWICITPITPIENESKYKRKVANIIMLLWLPTVWICDWSDKILNSISLSDFRSANQVTSCRKSRHYIVWLLEFTQTPLKRKNKLQMHLLFLKKSFKVSKFQWYNFSRKNQKLANLHWRILQTIYLFIYLLPPVWSAYDDSLHSAVVKVDLRRYTDFNHTNNRGV